MPKINYHANKTEHFDPILHKYNSLHTTTPCFYTIHST